MWERGWTLLAWKLDSRGTVVDVVVVPDDVVGGSTGAYRRRRGGRNNKYTAMIAIQITDIANAMITMFYCNATHCRRIGDLSGNFTGSGYLPDRRTGGEQFRVRCVRWGWWNNGQRIRVRCIFLVNFDVQIIFIRITV